MTAAGVAEHTSRHTKLHFLYEDLEEDDFSVFDFLKNFPHVELERHRIKDAFFKDWPEMQWTRAIYYRLIMPDLLADLEKVIYLDCDLAVLDDLGKLYDEPMGDNLCMAVVTKIGENHTRKLNIPPEKYFNSGVLVFSPAGLKRLDMVEKFKTCFEQYAELLVYPDQDILNLVFLDKVKILHPRWNIITSTFRNEPVPCYSIDEVKEAFRSPGIAHYTGAYKPWRLKKSFHHPYSLALKHLAEVSGQRKIAFVLKLKSFFFPHIAKPKKKLPWDKTIVDVTLLK
jgi:lipopolysaccharide biosynthesis glycosyltransferase